MTVTHPPTAWVTLSDATFLMGSDDFYPDEAPRHRRKIAAFRLSATPVTNDQFAAFVDDTGYTTVAERPLSKDDYPTFDAAALAPGSMVFTPTAGPVDLRDWQQWWEWRPGACWRHPRGPESTILHVGDHPVVQVSCADAEAYATWAGARLPTEAELEYAACGGSVPAPYAWGAERVPNGTIMANTWHGEFPHRNDGADGWRGTSAVGSFPPNSYGLADCIGNVWEWSADIYTPFHHAPKDVQGSAAPAVPPAASDCGCRPSALPGREAASSAGVPQRVLKGGSHLCAPEYCLRYRPAARIPQAEDSATTHIGFRIAQSAAP